MNIFFCKKCGEILNDIPPNSCKNGHIPNLTDDNIFSFCNDNNLSLTGENQYIGYDSLAEKYDLTRILEDEIREKISINLKKNIGNAKIALDIASGTGNFSIMLCAFFDFVISGDISIKMLQKLKDKIDKNNIRNIFACKMNIYDIPIKRNSIDMVFAAHIFHLINNSDMAIREIKRVLKTNHPLVTLFFEELESTENDLNAEIEELYYEELKRKKIDTLSVHNLPPNGLHEYLESQFTSCKIIETDDLVWETVSTPEYALDQTLSKQNPDQLLIDPEIHRQIRAKVLDTIEQKYGKSFVKIEVVNKLKVQIGFYYT
jgi:ubiquinone/menaquinone biosynthesis C-methylase UbiE